MVEDSRVEKELERVERADAEEVRNHLVGGRCLPDAPGNGRHVILTLSGRGHRFLWTRFRQGGLVEDEGGELEVRVFQVPFKIPVLD